MPSTTTKLDRVQLQHRLTGTLKALGDMCHFTEAKLMESAKAKTHLSNFGEEDFRTPMNMLIELFNGDPNISIRGRYMAMGVCFVSLINRLALKASFDHYPQFLEKPIKRPLFIVSCPRTGTTMLHKLLGQDPNARVPLLWELMFPCPPPHPDHLEEDVRIPRAVKLIEKTYEAMPELPSIHPQDPLGPDECFYLFQNSFTTFLYSVIRPLDGYKDWILSSDMSPAYEYYKKQLQMLQGFISGDHRVLKCPQHLYFLDSLLEVFPDACIVQLHRPPMKFIGSVCSMATTLRRAYHSKPDKAAIGQEALEDWRVATDRAMAVREKADPKQFLDIHFSQLVGDPIATVRKIYDYFDYEYSERMERNMRRWLAENQRHKHGKHRYRLEDYGLNEEMVNAAFQKYTDHYGIETDPDGARHGRDDAKEENLTADEKLRKVPA